ncbi:MAG: hypothetical protein ACK4UN_06330, partial [Limisphaerales bacterium]
PACIDPLVQMVTGIYAVELRESIRRLEKAYTGFQRSKHRAYPKLFTAVHLASKLHDEPARVPVLDAAALSFLKEALSDGSLLPDDQTELGEAFLQTWGSSFFSRHREPVKKIVEEAGNDFRWLALVLEGELQVQAAWKARGGGYANTVTQEKWEQFYEKLALARKAFTQAWKLHPERPLAPARMVYVALSDSGEQEMLTWFQRTLDAQIDFDQAWSDMRWGLRPRWHGNLKKMLALGISAIESGRFDTDVPRKFFDVVKDIEAEMELKRGERILGESYIWPHLEKMYEGYIAEPTQAEWRKGWQSTYATVAYLAGKYDVSRKQLEALDWQPNSESLKGWGRDLSMLPLEVAARTSEHKADVGKAEARFNAGDISGALKLFTALQVSTNDTRTTEFIQRRVSALKIMDRLNAGEWVDYLPSSPNDPNYSFVRGEFKTLKDGALEVSSDSNGHLAYSFVPVGTHFEARGQFEVVRSSNREFQGGLVMGVPDLNNTAWYSFRMKSNKLDGQIASFANGWSKRQVYHPVKLNSDTNTFTFRFENGKASATVNDQTVFIAVPPPRTNSVPDKEFLFGVGAFNDMNDTVIRYRNVQVRRLSKGNTTIAKE